MIFATDLDKTLIYSYRHLTDETHNVEIVEFKDDKPLSYMTNKAFNTLWRLKQRTDMIIVPVTARSTDQFNRILVTGNCPYAIVASGATILENGKPMKDWDNIVTKIREQNTDIYKLFMSQLSQIDSPDDSSSKDDMAEPYFEIQPRLVNNSVIFFKLTEKAIASRFPVRLKKEADKHDWNFTLQGQKGYLAPKGISKENALSYLSVKLKDDDIITAGDGTLDVPFIKLGNIMKFIPEYSEAYYHQDECSPCIIIPNGLIGVDTMLDIISKIYI